MPRGAPFRPPTLQASPEVQWLLLRAFGPRDAPPPAALEGNVALELAAAFGLEVRIAARADPSRLVSEIGEAAAIALIAAGARAVARDRRLVELIGQLASCASRRRLPVAFLKFAALRLTGAVLAGGRPANDIDILVPREGVAILAERLREIGFQDEPNALPPANHQLPILVSPGGLVVEIHRFLPAVRLDRRQAFADFEAVRGEGMLVPAPGLPDECFVPSREFLAAHAIAHGIAQHGLAPASYPLARMLADVIDLGFAATQPDPVVQRWIAQDVTWDEHSGLVRLCRRLAAGDPTLFEDPAADDPANVLLRHIVAGTLSAEYRRSLKMAHLLGQPTERSRPIARLRAIGELLWLNDAQLERLHGPRSSLGLLGLRVVRPFRLAARWARHRQR